MAGKSDGQREENRRREAAVDVLAGIGLLLLFGIAGGFCLLIEAVKELAEAKRSNRARPLRNQHRVAIAQNSAGIVEVDSGYALTSAERTTGLRNLDDQHLLVTFVLILLFGLIGFRLLSTVLWLILGGVELLVLGTALVMFMMLFFNPRTN
ncbi:unnamed protein product, partial [Mesorhabditis spiculigera]